jgi:hypothetical protein
VVLPVEHFAANGNVGLNCLSQPRGQPQTAVDPYLGGTKSVRRHHLEEAQKIWIQGLSIIGQAMKQEPTDEDWLLSRADAQVHLGTIQTQLRSSAGSAAMAKQGISGMRELAKREQASALILDMTANDLLIVEPKALRDPHFAVACAERAVALSNRKAPSMLLTLAQAYRADGQMGKSVAIAHVGLALLPEIPPGGVKPRIRKLLEMQTQTGN